ncbi:MAG: CARDB domain-containing protein, partial [Thermoplasmatota archaeon]
IKPAEISFKVENPKDIRLENVTVGLFIDDKLIETTKIELGPNESKTVNMNWSKEGIEEGEHILKVGINYGYGSSSEFNIILEKTIYIGEKSYALYNWGISLALVGLVVLFFLYIRKKRKRRRPW